MRIGYPYYRAAQLFIKPTDRVERQRKARSVYSSFLRARRVREETEWGAVLKRRHHQEGKRGGGGEKGFGDKGIPHFHGGTK